MDHANESVGRGLHGVHESVATERKEGLDNDTVCLLLPKILQPDLEEVVNAQADWSRLPARPNLQLLSL